MEFGQEKEYYVYAWFYKQSGKLFYVGNGNTNMTIPCRAN